MNTREKREWRREERIINTYQKDRLFRLQFELKDSGIVISQSNNSSPYTFPYRNELTPEKVKKITIKGNIQIKRLFYGYISNYNQQNEQSIARGLSERQPNPPYQHQQLHQDQHQPAQPQLPLYPHDAYPNRTTTRPTSVFETLPPVHLGDHNSAPWSYAQPSFASSSDQPSMSYQQQNHPAQPYSGHDNHVSLNRNNTLPSFHQSPSSPFDIPPPPYHSIQPSAPTVDDSHEEKFYDTRDNCEPNSSAMMSSSAVTSTPTPPPRPIRRKMSEAMAVSRASFRASIPPPRPRPPRPPRPTAQHEKLFQINNEVSGKYVVQMLQP